VKASVIQTLSILFGMMPGVSVRDEGVRDHVLQPARRQRCAEEGSQIPLPTQMQNDLRQLKSAGADCESQLDLNAVDTVRYDTRDQHAGRGGPGPHAAARQKAKLCSEEGSQIPLPTQMQNGMMQLESVGADSDVQCDLDAVDAVRCDTRSQHVERGGPGPRAAARQKATLC